MKKSKGSLKGAGYKSITGRELKSMMGKYDDLLIIDVRDAQDFYYNHIPNAINIPADTINYNLNTIALYKYNKIVVYCKTGVRSNSVCQTLYDNGFLYIYNLKGGISSYKR